MSRTGVYVRTFIFRLDVNLISKRHIHVQSSSSAHEPLYDGKMPCCVAVNCTNRPEKGQKCFSSQRANVGKNGCGICVEISGCLPEHRAYAKYEIFFATFLFNVIIKSITIIDFILILQGSFGFNFFKPSARCVSNWDSSKCSVEKDLSKNYVCIKNNSKNKSAQ